MFLFFLTLEKLVFTMFQGEKCCYGLFFMIHFQFFWFCHFPFVTTKMRVKMSKFVLYGCRTGEEEAKGNLKTSVKTMDEEKNQ